MTERRHRRGNDTFGKAFLINVGYIENFKAVRAVCGVEVFAAQLHIQYVAMVFVGFRQLPLAAEMLFVIVGIGHLVQARSVHRLRLVALGHRGDAADMGDDAREHLTCEALCPGGAR